MQRCVKMQNDLNNGRCFFLKLEITVKFGPCDIDDVINLHDMLIVICHQFVTTYRTLHRFGYNADQFV